MLLAVTYEWGVRHVLAQGVAALVMDAVASDHQCCQPTPSTLA